METRRIQTPPVNIEQFVGEMLPEYERIYGKAAAVAYRLAAPTQLAATIAHPAIQAYALLEDNHAQAMLFVQTTATRHTLSFFHVLQERNITSLGAALLQAMLSDIPKEDTRLIISDYIALGRLELGATYNACGFQKIKRQIMRKPCVRPGTTGSTDYNFRYCEMDDIRALASVLYAAYAKHPEQFLYEEVQSEEAACTFLHRCLRGSYGSCPRDYAIGAWRGNTCVGLIVGAEVVPEMGFVLHMAVLPSHQGQGIGTGLLNALTARFSERNIALVALGVTCDNGAAHLYKTLDFETVRSFTVYYRMEPASNLNSSDHNA